MSETDVQKTGSRKRVGLIAGGVVAVVLVVALVAFQSQIKSALKLLFKTQPVHAKHIPRQSFLVSRTNLATLALKTGLQKSPNDPLYKKMRELGSKLYPRFEELIADPEKETGLDLADDVYAFSELVNGQRPSVGILLGISNKKRFAEFVQRLRPGAANEADGISLVRLDGATVLCWNKSFALVYGGLPGDALEQRAKAVMAMESRDSIVDDAKKKAWIEGRDDCLVSLDLGQITALPDIEQLLRKGLYRPEIYTDSILQGALNFDKGKFLLETTASGAALLAEAKKTSAPPSKEFLAGIPVRSYQGFLAGRVPFAYLVESYRQADQNLYDKVNGMVLQSTSSTLAALAESLTGDLCLVFEGITPPSAPSARPQLAGTLAFGIKPGSALETVVHNNLRNAPPAIVARDGSFYRITMANATYLVAGNGYLALASDRAAAQSMAERRSGAAAVMPGALLDRATDSTGLLELKLGELFTALAAFDRLPGDARSGMEILGSYLKELNVTSRLEQDRATSRMELLFKNTSRNSLNQFASLSMALAEVRASRGQVR
jgi:hypothetical protein